MAASIDPYRGVPSRRYYYLSRTGNRIALPGTTQIDLIAMDYLDVPRAYANVAPETQLGDVAHYLMTGSTRSSYLSINDPIGISLGPLVDWESLVRYPIHPDANFRVAEALTWGPSRDRLEAYLDSIGIIHLDVDELLKLNHTTRFFLLTRFYLPGSIQTGVYRRLLQVAESDEAIHLLNQHAGQTWLSQHTSDMVTILQACNQGGLEAVADLLRTPNLDWARDHLDQYLPLVEASPDLTLAQLQAMTVDQVPAVVRTQSDHQLLRLVNPVGSVESRNRLVAIVEDMLTYTGLWLGTNNVWIHPHRGQLRLDYTQACRSLVDLSPPESTECFLLRNLLRPVVTHLPDLITWWRHSQDWSDPNDRHRYTEADLRRMFIWLHSLNHPLAATIEGCLDQIQAQGLQVETTLTRLRQIPVGLIEPVLTSYFHLGWYMRQWRGPGHPYPINESETGVEPRVGSKREDRIQQRIEQAALNLQTQIEKLSPSDQEQFWSLPLICVDSHRFRVVGPTLGQRYADVFANYHHPSHLLCIRTASTHWVQSGALYTRLILGRDPDGWSHLQDCDFIV